MTLRPAGGVITRVGDVVSIIISLLAFKAPVVPDAIRVRSRLFPALSLIVAELRLIEIAFRSDEFSPVLTI